MPHTLTAASETRVEGAVEPDRVPRAESVRSIVTELEVDPARCDEMTIRGPFAKLREALQESGATAPIDLVAEELAFTVHLRGIEATSEWGIVFGPLMSGANADGTPWTYPSLTDISSDVRTYWRQRADTSTHPVLRARYAHLLWEFPKVLVGVPRDASMARTAADAYLDAAEGQLYTHDILAIDRAERALRLALEISDATRVARARDVLLALEARVADDELLGTWGFCFEALLEPPNAKIALGDVIGDQLVTAMEERLARFGDGPPDAFHPSGPEKAALLLARHYRRVNRTTDLHRVLRAYGEIVRRLQGTAAPLVASHSLERLYDQFKQFDMHKEADALNEVMREVGRATMAAMKEISTTVEIPTAEFDAFIASMLAGTSTDVLRRLAVEWLPRRTVLEAELRDLAVHAPFQFHIVRTLKDSDGRTVAMIRPLDEDLESHYVVHVAQHLKITAALLREGLRRGAQEGVLDAAGILAFLRQSPCFPEDRHTLLAVGIESYVRGDAIVAIHTLIPQIEHAIRQVATAVQAPIYVPRKGGGFKLRTLDDLLRDSTIATALGPVFTQDVLPYLRVLLTDARGWNVRNIVCHGLAAPSHLSMSVADRVLHAALMLALLRWT